MKIAKMVAFLGVLAMATALIYGFTQGDFGKDGGELLRNPWGIVSLVDLYTGFILFSGWVFYRESSPVSAILWIILIMVLGFFAGALYTLVALYSSQGEWSTFWMGEHAPD